MPRLWNETIESHRAAVRDAILDSTAALVGEHGLSAVTMSQIAEASGIGRATLYKYFPDVAAIVDAWHEREIAGHLAQLAAARERAVRSGGGARDQLAAVLEAYALIAHERPVEHHGPGHRGSPHRSETVRGAGHRADLDSSRRHDTELAALLHHDRGGHAAQARRELTSFIRELAADGAAQGEIRDDVSPAELATFCLHALAAARSEPSRAAVRRLVGLTLDALSPRGR